MTCLELKTKMAILGIGKEWIFLFCGCLIAGIIFWVGIEGIGVKAILMWSFIGFGFLTVIMHACGSPIGGTISFLLQAAAKEKVENKPLFSEDELAMRREHSLKRKQGLHNEKAESYRENVLKPREESLRKKKEDELYKFTRWKDRGHKLGSASGELEDFDTNEHIEEKQNLGNSTVSGLESDFACAPPIVEKRCADFELEGTTLRRRAKEGKDEFPNGSSSKLKYSDNRKKEKKYLCEEPPLGANGVITVRLRPPAGQMIKRRFSISSLLKELVEYVDWLGYPQSEYVILTTYPREPLPDLLSTFGEAGFTHDTAFVIEEL